MASWGLSESNKGKSGAGDDPGYGRGGSEGKFVVGGEGLGDRKRAANRSGGGGASVFLVEGFFEGIEEWEAGVVVS